MPQPLIIAPASATAVGTTLRRYRHRLADEFGSWLETTVSDTAAVGDTTRVVLADELRDDEDGYDFLGSWLYVRDGALAETQRRIVRQPEAGYLGAMGGLTLSRPLDSVLESGSAIEVTSPLPIKRHLGIKGINDLVNEGLQLCRIRALVSFTGNGGYAYALDDYPWLFTEWQTGGIYDASYLLVSDPPMANPSSTYRIEADGVTKRLVTTRSYASGETFSLEVFVRGDLLVYDGSDWLYTATPGLQGDDWQAACPEHWVIAFGMVKGLDYLMRHVRQRTDLGAQEKAAFMAEILDRRKLWFRAARRVQVYELPRQPAPRSEPMVGIGSSYGGYRWS